MCKKTSCELVFKTDISQMCEGCPEAEKIREYIITQIEFQIRIQKDILTKDQFNDYLDKETEKAQNSMMEMNLAELEYKEIKKDKYRRNRSKIFIWNKERIKKLNEFKADKNNNTLSETPSLNFSNQSLYNAIEAAFSFMQGIDPRKHKRILDEEDFYKLIDWVYYFFDNNFNLPTIDQPIEKINTNKGNAQYAFIELFKKLHPSHTKPDSLFLLIKSCFQEYRNDNIENIKKCKKPQYYDELISQTNYN